MKILAELRTYWRAPRPTLWLFFRARQESAHQRQHDSSGISTGVKKACMAKPASIHTLGHPAAAGPKGYFKVRYHGILASRNRQRSWANRFLA
ncbi:MAG: hypothetical protein ACE5HO_06325 [bacterium]